MFTSENALRFVLVPLGSPKILCCDTTEVQPLASPRPARVLGTWVE